MRALAVIAQPLAVVAHQDDRRLIVQLMCLEVSNQAADDLVDACDGSRRRTTTDLKMPCAAYGG